METNKKTNSLNGIISLSNPKLLLIVGIVMMSFSHLNFNIDFLAWGAMIPFLIYLRKEKVSYKWLYFILALITAWSLIVIKIITNPIPYYLVPMYSIPIALFHLPAYIVYAKIKSDKWAIMAFPALMVVMEWIQYTFTPLASWGAAAYTQTDTAVITQSLALFGMSGLGFMIYWFNTALAAVISSKSIKFSVIYPPLVIIGLMVIYGSLRISAYNAHSKETLKVAAVGTDSEIGGLPLPTWSENEDVIQDIFNRTSTAASAGAGIVVWTEAAFFLTPDNEDAWQDSISDLAKKQKVTLIASYINLLSESPMRYENKFLFVTPDGKINYEYYKHQPVPGEPAVKGKEPLQTINVNDSDIGGAICYDYDFPYLAQSYSKVGADIVALPSSDWRGIDPLHTKMASFRAIEQGQSLIRSTRFGLSAGIDPLGQFTARMSSFDKHDKVMITELPSSGLKTLYSIIGDIFVYLCITFLFYLIFLALRKQFKASNKSKHD